MTTRMNRSTDMMPQHCNRRQTVGRRTNSRRPVSVRIELETMKHEAQTNSNNKTHRCMENSTSIGAATTCSKSVGRSRGASKAFSSPKPSAASAMSTSSPRSSPTGGVAAYAGAKFSEPPSPKTLPSPPSHWMSSPLQQGAPTLSSTLNKNSLNAMASDIKSLIGVSHPTNYGLS